MSARPQLPRRRVTEATDCQRATCKAPRGAIPAGAWAYISPSDQICCGECALLIDPRPRHLQRGPGRGFDPDEDRDAERCDGMPSRRGRVGFGRRW